MRHRGSGGCAVGLYGCGRIAGAVRDGGCGHHQRGLRPGGYGHPGDAGQPGGSPLDLAAAADAHCGSTQGAPALAGVQSGFTDAAALRALCATADVGITSADYALADTGTLVMLASAV